MPDTTPQFTLVPDPDYNPPGAPPQGRFTLTPDEPAAPATPSTANFMGAAVDPLVAAWQGTSPNVASGGHYNYQIAPDEAQWRFKEQGWQGLSDKYEVALRDPADGQTKVYLRNPGMDESGWGGAALATGRMLALGVPEGGIFGPAAASARAAPILQDFARTGVDPTIPVVSGGPAAGYAASIMSKLPGVSGPLVRGAKTFATQGGEALERFAGAEPYTNAELVDAFTTKSKNLYNQFWSQMDQDKQVPLPNTLKALQGPSKAYPSVPGLGEEIADPTLKKYYDLISRAGGTMTAPELANFRTEIGDMMGAPPTIRSASDAQLANVYRALTSDLRTEAEATNPAALPAFDQASNYYWAGRNRIAKLEPILNQAAPAATMNGLNKNIDDLEKIGSQMPADEWRGVGAAVLRRMGEPPAASKEVEQVQAQTPEFSPTAFATNYVRLSDRAKDALFGNVGTEMRDNIDALARVAGRAKALSRFANPAGTGHMIAAGAESVGLPILAYEYGDKLLEHPIATSIGMLGAYAAPRALMNPGFTRWLYNLPYAMNNANTPAQGAVRSLSTLDNLARSDPNLLPFAKNLRDILTPLAPLMPQPTSFP